MGLLNPSDINNPSLPYSTQKFFHNAFGKAGALIVHGINNKDKTITNFDEKECKVYNINTIIRTVLEQTGVLHSEMPVIASPPEMIITSILQRYIIFNILVYEYCVTFLNFAIRYIALVRFLTGAFFMSKTVNFGI